MIAPECTASTAHIEVPGCYILPDFISVEEEDLLLSNEFAIENERWESTIQRRVQHYGYIFNYKTFMVDYMTSILPIPSNLDGIVTRMKDFHQQMHSTVQETCQLNQMTANEYNPGQGIAPHVDTEACFGPYIFILNLGSGIVMTLREKGDGSEEQEKSLKKKHLWLPPRSLLILENESRYSWSHGIAPRSNDMVEGVLLQRTSRRVSLTFRQALLPGEIPKEKLVGTTIEQDHVFRVYDNIAIHWNHTRGKRKVYWHRVKSFLEELPAGTLLGDIGCGDGKYFGVNPGVYSIGNDRSLKLLEVSYNTKFDTFCCDAVKVPLRDNIFDATICIAVLHHFSTVERRISLIRELLRVTTVGGIIFVQAWALEQGDDCRHKFNEQDVMVPWKLQERFYHPEKKDDLPVEGASAISLKRNLDIDRTVDVSPEGSCEHAVKQEKQLVYQRYCHVYKEGELVALCSSIPGCRLLDSGWDKGNWYVKLLKFHDDRLSAMGPSVPLPAMARNI